MRKTILLLALTSVLASCKSDQEKDQEKTANCLEEKTASLSHKSIDEALANYDFVTARNYLACYSDFCYDNSGGKWSCEYASHGLSPYRKELVKIVRAEISYLLTQNEPTKAEACAKEADLMEIYEQLSQQIFETNIDNIIDQGDFKKIYYFLANKRIKYQSAKYDLDMYPSYSENSEYNEQIREYNAVIDKVLVKYKYENVDKKELKSIIELSLPELVESNRGKDKGVGSKLSDIYKKEAILKYIQ